MNNLNGRVARVMTNDFRFGRYDAAELETCGDRFLAHVRRTGRTDDPEQRTDAVLDWFAESAPLGMVVNARPGHGESRGRRKHDTGEWMVDLAHSSYALADNRDYWPRVLSGSLPCTIRLALEVKWGGRNDVIDGASKLAAIRSDAKVVVSSVGGSSELFQNLARLRELTGDPAPWLCIDLGETASSRVLGHMIPRQDLLGAFRAMR